MAQGTLTCLATSATQQTHLSLPTTGDSKSSTASRLLPMTYIPLLRVQGRIASRSANEGIRNTPKFTLHHLSTDLSAPLGYVSSYASMPTTSAACSRTLNKTTNSGCREPQHLDASNSTIVSNLRCVLPVYRNSKLSYGFRCSLL